MTDTNTRTVYIPSTPDHEGIYGRTVTLNWVCPVCGGPRGEPFDTLSYDGSRRLHVHGWNNPCGHVDKYEDVCKEAGEVVRKLLISERDGLVIGSIDVDVSPTETPAPVSDALAVSCVLCEAPATTEIDGHALCAGCAEKVQARQSKIEARYTRLKAAAQRALDAFQTDHDTAHKMAQAIPFGQPIHIGHHSEKWDRRYRERIHTTFGRAFAHYDRAKQLEQRAATVGARDAISSDDPLALVKLQEKIDELKARQEEMKRVNAERRKAKQSPSYTFELRNNASEIRRLEARLKALQDKAQAAAAPDFVAEEMHGAVKLVRNTEANRLQLVFPGKPAPDVIKALRSRGFVWSPSNGAWQRQLSNAAEHAAEQILKSLE